MRYIILLFWFLILCIGGAGLYDELQCNTAAVYCGTAAVYCGTDAVHCGTDAVHCGTRYVNNDTISYGGNTHHSKKKKLTKNKILVFIIPSDQDLEFVKKVTDILNRTQFTPNNTSLEISNTNDENIDITLELGDRNTMHKNHKVEKDANGEIIYFSYTYNTTPRKIIFDPGNWLFGVKRSGLSLNDYRDYVVRHELMHALGYDHQECNEQSATVVNGEKVCPVMYQSTRGPPPGFICGSQITSIDYTAHLPW